MTYACTSTPKKKMAQVFVTEKSSTHGAFLAFTKGSPGLQPHRGPGAHGLFGELSFKGAGQHHAEAGHFNWGFHLATEKKGNHVCIDVGPPFDSVQLVYKHQFNYSYKMLQVPSTIVNLEL